MKKTTKKKYASTHRATKAAAGSTRWANRHCLAEREERRRCLACQGKRDSPIEGRWQPLSALCGTGTGQEHLSWGSVFWQPPETSFVGVPQPGGVGLEAGRCPWLPSGFSRGFCT